MAAINAHYYNVTVYKMPFRARIIDLEFYENHLSGESGNSVVTNEWEPRILDKTSPGSYTEEFECFCLFLRLFQLHAIAYTTHRLGWDVFNETFICLF